MSNAILNLDETRTWPTDISDSIYAPDVWPTLSHDFDTTCDIFQELSFGSEYLKTSVVIRLRADTEALLREQYTEAVAYHACRPLDLASYQRIGLQPTTRDLLVRQARVVFNGFPNLEAEIDAECDKYLKWYDGCLGLFPSATDALHTRTTWATQSCFLGRLADRFGQTGKIRLKETLATITPTLIKCLLPMTWLDSRMREPSVGVYAILLLQKLIRAKKTPDDLACGCLAIALKHPLPPENIMGFVDATHCIKEE